MKFLLSLFSASVLILMGSSPVQAEVIRSFDAQITADSNGLMTVVEKINYDFETEVRHGIFRFIPTVSRVGELYRVIEINDIKVTRDGSREDFEKSNEGSQVYLKIGDPDETISGAHTYEITYQVENGIGSNFEDHDEIYWNVTGDGWEVPINTASATISAPVASNGARCFTGSEGSTASNCTIDNNNSFTANNLNPFEGLTVVTSYPVGTFPKSTLQKNSPGSLQEFISNPLVQILGVGIPIILNFGLAPYLIYWFGQNRNKKKYGPATVNFDFPSDSQGKRITPLEAGIMDTTKIDRDDVLATIYDLAIRKYIQVVQVKKDRKVLGMDVGDKEEFVIKKLKDYADVQSFEKTLLERLFQAGNEVEINSLKKDFYKTFQEMEKNSFQVLKDKGFYTKNPKNQKGGLAVAGVFSLIALSPILAGVLFYLAAKMNGRTVLGDSTDWKIDGLKLFLSGRSREYNWNAQNLHTVEQMIPYAMSLGYVEKFMKQFQIHYPDYDPYWYHGHSPLYHSFYGMNSSLSSNLTTSAPSSSSGMGGGGSSGGGGGGGGGGSW